MMKYYAIMLSETNGYVKILEVSKDEAFKLDQESPGEIAIIKGRIIKPAAMPAGSVSWN